MPSVRELRRLLRHRRRLLSPAEQRRHARQLARVLGTQRIFLRARRIGAYFHADGELDPGPLLAGIQDRQSAHFPVLRPHPKKTLWFVRTRPGDPLVPNRYSIPEPRLRQRRLRLPWALDLLLLPLVGFDAQCHRLGMGGGYYDQTLAYLRQRTHWKPPRLIGIAHECQRVERLEPQPWDIPMDAIATEARMYWRRPPEKSG